MLPLSLSPSAKDSPGGLTAEELEHLGKYINPDYLKGDIVDKIKRNFRINDDSMQLASVLKADLARRIGTLIKRADRKGESAGVGTVIKGRL